MGYGPLMVERELFAIQRDSGWEDEYGMIGPYRPGVGPRSNPVTGTFPTGPAIGERLPDLVAPAHTGETIDVHGLRADGPAVVVFYRSAVW